MPKEASQDSGSYGLNDDDLQKMVSDAVFYCLIADQKKATIKVNRIGWGALCPSIFILFRKVICSSPAT